MRADRTREEAGFRTQDLGLPHRAPLKVSASVYSARILVAQVEVVGETGDFEPQAEPKVAATTATTNRACL